MAMYAYAGPIEPRSLDICIEVAKELNLSLLDVKTLTDRCECVGQKRNGALRLSKVTWSKSSKSNFALDLVDCAKGDIVNLAVLPPIKLPVQDSTNKALMMAMRNDSVHALEIAHTTNCAV